jgi:hypothetical protein
MYAIASDCYLRAGERQIALDMAHKGLPFVSSVIESASRDIGDAKKRTKSELTRSALGRGTEPVVALYRAGAIAEATSTGYLTGRDRYENALVAGEKPDPQWVLDYDERLGTISMVWNAIAGHEIETQKQVYDAISAWCKAKVSCAKGDDETNEQLASLAAAMGDRTTMEFQLNSAVKAIDESSSGLSAVDLAGKWLSDLQLLREAKLAQQGPEIPHGE